MAEAAAHASPGALVLGRYCPIRPLGSGGSGSVWLARDEPSGREIALKIVPREGTAGPRAEREATAAARLRHERCLRAYALARDSGHVYIAYEYVAGRTLREALRSGELEDGEALEVGAQIFEGLAHAHAHGVVHRDVKPANVLLAAGPSVSVKLLDFGLALMREEETLTAVGDIPGTLAYISPERLRGEQAGPAADIWSGGVLLWEALTDRHPFWNGTLLETARSIQAGAPSLATERPDLPEHVVALVDGMLSVDPKRRPQAKRLATSLRRPPPRRARPKPPVGKQSHRIPVGQLAAVTTPAAAAALFSGWTAATFPFFPSSWWVGLALCALALTAWRPRAGLAFSLAVPILPLGNHSLGLAIVYVIVATAWLAACWREPRSGLFPVVGPLLAPFSALGLLPLAAQVVRSPWRRALHTATAVLLAGAVTGANHLGGLGIAGASRPLTAASALRHALLAHPSYLMQAAVLAAAAVALPYARARGPWAIGALGAAVLALALTPIRNLPTLPLVLTMLVTCGLLAAEPALRQRVFATRGRARLAVEAQLPLS